MSVAFALPDDLAAAWRPLTDDELERADRLIGYASARVRNRVPGIDDAILAGTVDPLLVEEVVVTMVKRAMASAEREGVTQDTESTGPFARGATYANPLGNLYITDQEIRDLGGSPATGRARSMRLSGGYC